MTKTNKRPYRSAKRNLQAIATKNRILSTAKKLFEKEGFETVTIDKIAQEADVSIPTVYSLFQSKRGILRVLMDETFAPEQFKELVETSIREKCPKKRLSISAKIARQIYEAEKRQMSIFQSVSVLAPEFKELEKEREKRRYDRQEVTIKAMVKEKSLAEHLTEKKARDILWGFTGRDLYRMFVIEQGWTPDEYESWLAQLLISSLVKCEI